MNKAVTNGLLFGGTTIIIGLTIYTFSKPMFLNPGLRFILSLIIPITFMTKSGLEKRQELGGFARFTEILQPTFLTLVVGTLIFSIFQYIMMSVDYELLEIQKEIAVKSLESISGIMNMSEEDLADVQAIDPIEMKPTIRGLMMGLSKNFILGFIIAVVISLILKRKNLVSG